MSQFLQIKKQVKVILNRDEKAVVVLKGHWGVGKTYFWEEEVSKEIPQKTVYVSLFGKSSIDDIKNEILFQLFARNNLTTKSKRLLGNVKGTLGFKDEDLNLGITSGIFNAAITLLEKNDFKDVIICFDDLERKNKNLNIDEVFGYVSYLSEHKGCKVIVILNEDKAKQNEEVLKVYNEYKEKVIDFEFLINPTPFEALEFAYPLKPDYYDLLLNIYEKLEINNLRIIKKIKRMIDELTNNLPNDTKEQERAQKELIEKIIILACLYYEFGSDGINEFNEKAFISLLGEKEELPEKMKKYREFYGLKHSNWYDFLLNYLYSSIYSQEELEKVFCVVEKQYFELNERDQLSDLDDKFTYDFSYSSEKFSSQVMEILERNKEKAVSICQPQNFVFYINRALCFPNIDSSRINEIARECIKHYIDQIVENNQDKKHQLSYFLSDERHFKLFEFAPELKDYIEKQVAGISEAESVEEKACEIFKNIENHRSWGAQDASFLNSLTVVQIDEMLKKSKDFSLLALYFVRREQNHGNADFAFFVSNYLKVLETWIISGGDMRIKGERFMEIIEYAKK